MPSREPVRDSSHRPFDTVLLLKASALGLALLFWLPTRSGLADPSHESLVGDASAELEKHVTQGALRMVGRDGNVVECPLKHTDVRADIAGFIARVRVTQTFVNPATEKIEAVYVFPLPHEAAVDDMSMVLGDRRIVGVIRRRAEARQIYDEALYAGQTAALLEQERPNIFTQSVGNIPPGGEVEIEISYVDVLKYDMGSYEFHFPIVVGPRYDPGRPISPPPATPPELLGRVSLPVPGTTQVSDASRISPPVLKPGFRNGHDLELSVTLDAGVPVQDLKIANHRADIRRDAPNKAAITLANDDSIPNKDFVLHYRVVGKKPEMAVLTHTGEHSGDARRLGTGYLMLMIQPKQDERLTKSPPREIVFLVDVSGSMSGEPTAKVIETMRHMLKLCRPNDTIQVVTFASHATKLFEAPIPVNRANITRALNFAERLRGSGGTEMLKGVKLAIDEPLDQERIRIVVMLTDGYIGNEAQIIEHVGKHCGDRIRFWAIGIGSAPNMFLIDGVARQGGGMGKQLGLKDDSVALTQEVMTRIQRAQLTDVKIDWGSHQVLETYPAKLPELWAGRPLIVFGRYGGGRSGRITVSGSVEGEAVSWPLDVELPTDQPSHEVLAKVWARHKIEGLMHSTYYQGSPAVEEEVTALALDYRLMSQYTSFVAVDAGEASRFERPPQPPRRMLVPVPLPAGTRWEGFFGERVWDADEVADESTPRPSVKLQLRVARGPHSESSGRPGSGMAGGMMGMMGGADGKAGMGMGGAGKGGMGMGMGGIGIRGGAGDTPTRQKQIVRQAVVPAQEGMDKKAVTPVVTARRGAISQDVNIDRHNSSSLEQPRWAARTGSPREQAGGHGYFDQPELANAHYTARAMAGSAGQLQQQAQTALEFGLELHKQGKLRLAYSTVQRAYLFDTAAARLSSSSGEVAAEALTALEEIWKAQVAAWAQQMPGLDKRLDLVIRNRSIADALAAVSDASGVSIRLVEGSVEDAAGLLVDEPRVHYLDLRRASVGQALDWILQPARLTWWLDDSVVVAGSQRRSGAESPWVYDVAAISLPSGDELKQLKDHSKATAAAERAADEFIGAVRRELNVDDRQAIVWFGPGQILIIGNAETHAAAAKLFTSLADSKSKFEAISSLKDATRSREQPRNEMAAENQLDQRRVIAVAAAHEEFGWPLLSAAAVGQVDWEALTELQIAWNSPCTSKLLEGEGARLELRSLWVVCEAARAIPDEAELLDLAAAARKRAHAAIERSLVALENNPNDIDAFTRVLYSALALWDDEILRARAWPLLTATAPGSSLAGARVVAKALLVGRRAMDSDGLTRLVKSGLTGEDLLVLTALACRRAGGEAWANFRAESQRLLGSSPLPGSAVVLVNRLANPLLPIVVPR